MSQNGVLGTEEMRQNDSGRTANDVATTASLVRPLSCGAPSGALGFAQLNASTPRPFDAQYWACWAFVVLLPLLTASLWLTR